MFEHGIPFRLSPLVQRLVAPNPGMMTGPGTNTYLIGDRELAVLDPGPAIPEHIDAILAAGEGRIRWIVCSYRACLSYLPDLYVTCLRQVN